MSVDRQTVVAWLEAYLGAWASGDPEEIGELFSEDASYTYHPWEEPVRGRRAIVDSWLEETDAPGSFEAHYEPLAVDGDLAVATGWTHFPGRQGSPEKRYYNVFAIRFDESGRCASFKEWYLKRPAEEE